VKHWKTIYLANGPPKQVRVAILISDEVDFKPKLVRKNIECHFILIKGTIHAEEEQLSAYMHPMLLYPTVLNIL
jgi:hypothetical protein